MKIDYRIRLLRKSLNMTQEEFARHVGVSFKTINQWENKKSKPSKLAQQKLHEVAVGSGFADSNGVLIKGAKTNER